MENYAVGSAHRINLAGLAIGGEAVGRINDLVVFVPYGVPGDEIEVRLNEIKKNFARGEINRFFKSSPHRIVPLCPIFYKCGGCQLQQMSYGAQLIYKKKMVEEAVVHLGGLTEVKIEDTLEAADPWNYRNKMQVVAAAKPFLPPSKKFSPYFGLYAKKTHRVIKMDQCAIQHPLSNKVLQATKDILSRLDWEIYNEKTGEGLLRHLITRVSVSKDQVLLILVTTDLKIPSMSEFVNSITKKIPQIKGIVINQNTSRTNVILGSINKTVWGDDYLTEEVGGITYLVSAGSFFQVNPTQLERMLYILENFLEPDKGEVFLDAYCGVGAIALWMANKFRKVLGIEEVPQARKDAIESAALNNVGNLEILTGQVERILPTLYHQGIRINKAVLDPPRKGCEEEVLDIISKMRIRKLAYVSCNPATLTRDLAILKEKNYRTIRIHPIDMFPQTAHVECVAEIVYDPPSWIRKGSSPKDKEETAEKPKDEAEKPKKAVKKLSKKGSLLKSKKRISIKQKEEVIKPEETEPTSSSKFIEETVDSQEKSESVMPAESKTKMEQEEISAVPAAEETVSHKPEENESGTKEDSPKAEQISSKKESKEKPNEEPKSDNNTAEPEKSTETENEEKSDKTEDSHEETA